ncbi:Ig-like domain-containing protein [Photobacterium damselae]|uniref:Ig-like domain-containing protein n=1 Tax=Photobacterium damselae TaxID=38293 RepID=UPI001F2FA76E|nr:Ig-like domain-containing protein [Photobacterium damselae]UKA11859.1 Ig-like domain-containing protein [Photobacterium damselae subsp. damselae]
MKNIVKIKIIILLFFTTVLFACNGGSGDDANKPTDPNPITIERPIVSDSIESKYSKNDDELVEYEVNLADNIYDINNLPLEIDDFSVIGDDCKVSFDGLNAKVESRNKTICSIDYSVRNLPDDMSRSLTNHGVFTVIFSAYSDPYLPTISKASEPKEKIQINLKDELGVFYPTDGVLKNDFWATNGSSSVSLDTNNAIININSGDKPEIVQIRYGIDTPEGDIKFGIITVTISDRGNLAPEAKNNYLEVDTSVTPIDIDVSTLITDRDDNVDSLQILKVDSFDNVAKILTPTDVTNKKFQVNIENPGMYDVNYIITDHHGGYANAIIRIKVNVKKYWDDITLSSGVLYTAPWEKIGADLYGLPYQDLVDYTLDGVLFHIPMFNYESAESICRLRGMVIPTLRQLQDLNSEFNVHVDEDWPDAHYFWTSSKGNDVNTKTIYSLNSGDILKDAELAHPYFLTCVLPGLLSVDTLVDNSYTAHNASSSNYDVIEATVNDLTGLPLADSVVYLFTDDSDLMLEKQIAFTDTHGSATFNIRSKTGGEHSVTASYYSQNIKQKLNFILDSIIGYELLPAKADMIVGEKKRFEFYENHQSGEVIMLPPKEVDWKIYATSGAASVDADGIVKAISEGKVYLAAYPLGESSSGTTATAEITIKDPLLTIDLKPQRETINVSDSLNMTLIGNHQSGNALEIPANTVKWTVEDPAVLTINSNGVVTGKSEGTSVVTAEYGTLLDTAIITVNNPNPMVRIDVQPDRKTIVENEAFGLLLYGIYKNGDKTIIAGADATWDAIPGGIVSVTNGVVYGLKPGTAIVTAKYNDIFSDTAQITVKSDAKSLQIKGTDSLDLNDSPSSQLQSIYNGSENVTNRSTWSSSNTSIVSVSKDGLVTAIAPGGPITITNKYNGLTAVHSISVKLSGRHNLTYRSPTSCFVDHDNKPLITYQTFDVEFGSAIPSKPHTSNKIICKHDGKKDVWLNANWGDYIYTGNQSLVDYKVRSDSTSILEKIFATGDMPQMYLISEGKPLVGFKCLRAGEGHLVNSKGADLQLFCK